MDYCSKPKEVIKNPNAFKVMQFIAAGNDHALDFIWRCWNFCHMLDDLVDRDEEVAIEEVARELFLFIQTISLNQFFQLHKHSLLPLILNACNGWVAGEKAGSAVLKCSDFTIYSHVAFLIGGWEHMQNLDQIRSYDKE